MRDNPRHATDVGSRATKFMTARVGTCQEFKNDANSWANMVKRGTDKALSIVSNGINNVSIPPNGEAHQVIEPQSRSLGQEVHNKRDPMTVDYHICPPADEDVSISDDINKTENIVRMDEELSLAPPDTHATCPKATKWSDLISTESDSERDHEKHGKKRGKSSQRKFTNMKTMRAMTITQMPVLLSSLRRKVPNAQRKSK